ncbi:hypothetical protein [Cupriavidus gilardii]|uniref:hypothetical protein n=1 Tax=Cupriavidus gilardii TaxID=82541 RepID=UPI0021C05AE6|nr:hypothetical protein [Cupriavidus gilardii]MCT9125891.1 hypothetical protein [Cupriavidus gilardii]
MNEQSLVLAMQSIAQMLSAVPKELWAALIGAGIALLSAWRSNANARRMLKIQLVSATEQAEKKRQMDLRREVFLPAIRAAVEVPAIVGKMLDPKVSDQEIATEMRAAIAAFSGIHVVASAHTLTATTKLSTAAGKLYFDTLPRRAEIMIETAAAETIRSIIDAELQRGRALVEMMQEINLNGGDPERFERITTQWKAHQERLHDLEKERDAKDRAVSRLMANQLREFGRQIEGLTPFQAEALTAVRQELGLSIDKAEYLHIISEPMQDMKSSIAKAASFLEVLGQRHATANAEVAS